MLRSVLRRNKAVHLSMVQVSQVLAVIRTFTAPSLAMAAMSAILKAYFPTTCLRASLVLTGGGVFENPPIVKPDELSLGSSSI